MQELAEAMRQERIALKSYSGSSWESDGKLYITKTAHARQSFEKSLDAFVELLAHA